ncbi:peptidylprolyl isomerase [Alicyclobacillus tengchongensis]|nr:peptidylprolyl isomerase [Alicyclobacillus tengchongensis]
MKNARKWISPAIGAAAGAVIVGGVWFGTYIVHGSGSVIAMVGGKPITRSALLAETQAYAGASMLEELISNQLIQDAAAKKNITATQSEINQQLAALEAQNGITSDSELTSVLAQNHMTKAQLLDQIRVSVLEQKLAESKVNVTDEEIQNYYKQNKSSFAVPETRALSDIVVATKAKAEQIENDLRQGKSFAQLAKAYSTDSSTKAKGGAMGTFSEAELSASEPAIATAAFKLAKGQVSQPIAVSGSYEILQCTAVNPAHTPSLAEERSAIIQDIKQQNAESEPQLVAQLIKSDKVNILDPTYSSVLTQLENPTTTSTSSSGY